MKSFRQPMGNVDLTLTSQFAFLPVDKDKSAFTLMLAQEYTKGRKLLGCIPFPDRKGKDVIRLTKEELLQLVEEAKSCGWL